MFLPVWNPLAHFPVLLETSFLWWSAVSSYSIFLSLHAVVAVVVVVVGHSMQVVCFRVLNKAGWAGWLAGCPPHLLLAMTIQARCHHVCLELTFFLFLILSRPDYRVCVCLYVWAHFGFPLSKNQFNLLFFPLFKRQPTCQSRMTWFPSSLPFLRCCFGSPNELIAVDACNTLRTLFTYLLLNYALLYQVETPVRRFCRRAILATLFSSVGKTAWAIPAQAFEFLTHIMQIFSKAELKLTTLEETTHTRRFRWRTPRRRRGCPPPRSQRGQVVPLVNLRLPDLGLESGVDCKENTPSVSE